ncbi:BolA protein family transcriptional regulator [Bradymonas sediminis]|uniref:BolA family transcriptional regulator n=2 Tax=Bradymonas sediminis TaxID=1548548 RepID=A0A2Z4FR06_9DELT|nr:BolA family transcriptional regulator [Bradymonas sediminis]TDP75665.1 BolA protein family transcriptional regulator [Bradymonas sediminis]
MMEPEEIVSKIQAAIADAQVRVVDLTGTRDHFEATVISPSFDGLMPIKRHRMVYAALAEEMKGPIHALALKTLTPDEWDAQ